MDFLTRARQKSERLMVGLMSGTSADGVDACLCAIQGFGSDTDVEIKQLSSQDYSDEVKSMLIEGLPDLCLEDIARLNFAYSLKQLSNVLRKQAILHLKLMQYAHTGRP